MTDFVDVGPSSAVPEQGRHVVTAGGHSIALVRVEGRVYGVDNRCPHRDGELGQGDLDGFHLFCPLHAWVFDVRDGRGFFPRGAEVACFEVKEEHGRLLVALRGVKPSQTDRWP
ncbi:MAG: Rieske 2Fe-2S domain-containing protein [Myxococcus sp.]|nr:Rieske 2Fe-2S domain-containing protein [Myxococcus sp.]